MNHQPKKKWKVLLKKFCAKTTLKALPRVSRAKTFYARVFWFTIFTVLLVGASICIHLILTRYLDFSSFIESTTEWDIQSPFPSITICPHQPLKPEYATFLGQFGFTPRGLARRYEEWADAYQKKMRNITGNVYYLTEIPYPRYTTYYQYIPNRSNVQIAGRQSNRFIFDCKIFASSEKVIGENGYFEYCNGNPKIIRTHVVDAEHFNCYMYTMNSSYINRTREISFIINLESYHTGKIERAMVDECQQCMRWKPETWRTGARVVIHQANTRPNIKTDGLDLNPGSINELIIQVKKLFRLKPPYGNCQDGIEKRFVVDKGNQFQYTQQACQEHLLQQNLKENCKCLDPSVPLSEDDEKRLELGNYSFCENMQLLEGPSPAPSEEDLNKVMCAIGIKSKFSQDDNQDLCMQPCNSYAYTAQMKSTLGFDKSMLTAMYKQMRKENIITKPIPEMEAIIADIEAGNYSDAYERLSRNDNFMNNFVQLSIKRGDASLITENQRVSFDMTNMLSMIGGICSLFIGFSLFVAFEIVELIWNGIRLGYTATHRDIKPKGHSGGCAKQNGKKIGVVAKPHCAHYTKRRSGGKLKLYDATHHRQNVQNGKIPERYQYFTWDSDQAELERNPPIFIIEDNLNIHVTQNRNI